MLRVLSYSLLALGVAASLPAQRSPQAPPRAVPVTLDSTAPVTPDPLHAAGKDVTISLLTMGNGTEIWELFGHDALWIHDNATGRDTVFNWGVFSFRQSHFLARFLKGTMLYAMGGDSLDYLMYAYRYLNRSVYSQELDLTPAQRDDILSQIRENARPENINYRYDYFRDNCATRVRDILDNALGGQLKAQSQTLSGTSYRWHATRLMQSDRPIVLGVDIGLGRPSDTELTKWQEMFLPRKLHDFVSTMQVTDSTGAKHPLVKNEQVLFRSTRGPEPASPPVFGTRFVIAGLVLGALFFWLGTLATNGGRGARITAAIVIGGWSIAAGLLGVLLTLLWTVTDHVFAHANENLLLFNPLWLVLGVLLIASLWKGRISVWTERFALGLGGLAALALVAHFFGLSAQQNLPIIGLGLPPALAIAGLAGRAERARSAVALPIGLRVEG